MSSKRVSAFVLAGALVLAVCAAGSRAGTLLVKPPTCEPPPIGINVCVNKAKPAAVVPAGSWVTVTVEFASGVAIDEASLFGYTPDDVLIDRHFKLQAGKSRVFRVRLAVPAGTTEITFMAGSEVEGPYGHSVASLSVTGT